MQWCHWRGKFFIVPSSRNLFTKFETDALFDSETGGNLHSNREIDF